MYEAQDLGSGREYALKVRGRHILCAFLGALEAVSLWQRREGVFPVTGGLLPATCVHPVSSGGEELTATPGLAAASGLGAWGQVWPVVLRVPSEAPTSRWPQPLCDRCVHSVLGRVRWDSGRAGRWVLSGDSGAQPGLRRPSRVCSWAAPAPGPHLPPWARARPLSAAESPLLSLSWFTPPLGRTGSWAALLVCLGMGEGPCSGSGPLGAPTRAGPSAPVQLCRCGFKAAGTDLVCAPPTQRLLSSEEDRSRAIIQEVCFMVSFSRCLPKPAPPPSPGEQGLAYLLQTVSGRGCVLVLAPRVAVSGSGALSQRSPSPGLGSPSASCFGPWVRPHPVPSGGGPPVPTEDGGHS